MQIHLSCQSAPNSSMSLIKSYTVETLVTVHYVFSPWCVWRDMHVLVKEHWEVGRGLMFTAVLDMLCTP